MKTMSTNEIVLIVTNKTDVTADLVVLEFQRRGTPYVRFNTEDFPQRVQVAWTLDTNGVDGYMRFPRVELCLRDIKSVWYRRPSAPDIAESVRSSGFRNFARRESQEALSGLWRTLDCFWMSCPDAINYASYKPRQLQVASGLGFRVPITLISNSPDDAARFRSKHGQVIAKPLYSGDIEHENERMVVFTTPVTTCDLAATKSIHLAPTLFQEYIQKELELRVTIIGTQVFAASINSQNVVDALHDWRKASPESLCFRSYELPRSVSEKCARLVASFGLTFGTIDMVKTPSGEYVFLELNPNGQWGWLENLTGDAYTRAIATLLERGRVE